MGKGYSWYQGTCRNGHKREDYYRAGYCTGCGPYFRLPKPKKPREPKPPKPERYHMQNDEIRLWREFLREIGRKGTYVCIDTPPHETMNQSWLERSSPTRR